MTAVLDRETRDKLLADPGVILADRDLMRALVDARETQTGDKVVDIRGRAMEALENRLDRLEAQHESVIAAAYDNLSGTAVVHRAVIGLLETTDLGGLAVSLQAEIAPILRIETLRLVVEDTPALPGLSNDVSVIPAGHMDRLFAADRPNPRGDDITLRCAAEITRSLHGCDVESEALLPLALGARHPKAMLLLGSKDGSRFMPIHGTDLLRFFAQAFRLILLTRLKA